VKAIVKDNQQPVGTTYTPIDKSGKIGEAKVCPLDLVATDKEGEELRQAADPDGSLGLVIVVYSDTAGKFDWSQDISQRKPLLLQWPDGGQSRVGQVLQQMTDTPAHITDDGQLIGTGPTFHWNVPPNLPADNSGGVANVDFMALAANAGASVGEKLCLLAIADLRKALGK
jgi:hypothetical protein